MDIRGAASTFDGTVYWRVMDPVGHLLASGFTKVNPRAAASGEQFSPNTGSYFAVAKFQIGSNTGGYLEVYSLSQLGDGKIADSVRVDLHIEAP